VALRTGTGKDGPVLTESGGVLADLLVPSGVVVTDGLDRQTRSVPGVMDTGYFAPSPKREFVAGYE
jgi:ribose 5-phosphate isomerase